MLRNFESELDILSNKKIDKFSIEQTISQINKKIPNGKAIKSKLLDAAVVALKNAIKERNYEKSYGLLRFSLFADFINPMATLKNEGIFRSSKYNFDAKLISELSRYLIRCPFVSNADATYLSNVNGLLLLAPDLSNRKKKIICAATSRRYFLKSLLAITEEKFKNLLNEPPAKNIIIEDHIFNKNKESIVTGASYAMQVYREVRPELSLLEGSELDESDNENYYLDIIRDAFTITKFLEMEIQVDYFGHKTTYIENSKIKLINIINDDFELAKAHGYTKALLRAEAELYRDRKNLKESNYLSFLEHIWKTDSDRSQSRLYELRAIPKNRIVLKTTIFSYGHALNIFGSNELFSNEALQLKQFMQENYRPDVINIKLYDEFQIIDIVKLQRLFYYIGFIYDQAYKKISSEGHPDLTNIRKRSLLPLIDAAALVDIFSQISGKSKEKCEGLIGQLSYAKQTEGEFIDLQYKPFIKIDGSYLILPTIFAASDLVRSLAISKKVHLSVVEKHDPMIMTVTEVLRKKGFFVKSDFQFGKDEADIIAQKGENLFIFECKNPYHPVNDFELRNTYAHLCKGFDQLENFKNRLSDPHTLRQLLKNLGLENVNVKHTQFAIINANRALTGLMINEIQVVHANELINFISTGTITTGEIVLSCWKSKKFSSEDLSNYLSGKVLSRDLYENSLDVATGFFFRARTVAFKLYSFDVDKTSKIQAKKYRRLKAK
jgi:hypothetical protein